MTEPRPVDRRAGNEELIRRVEFIEKKVCEMADAAVKREEKLTDIFNVIDSGKGAVRILYWLGLAAVFLATSWDWIIAHLPRASG